MNSCACGCGIEVKRKWAHGHHARIKNPSKLPHIKELRRQQMQAWHDSGTRPTIWNKGLNGDPRCLLGGQKAAQTRINDPECHRISSESMKRNRQTLRGKDHWNWKGGHASITQMLRGNSRFYNVWKRPILARDKFKCTECGQTRNLNVHHDEQTFGEILSKFLSSDRDVLTHEEKQSIREQVIDYHVEHNVSGVVLCVKCHKAEHAKEKTNV